MTVSSEGKSFIDRIREKKPVIECITNIVTVNDCANILLAIGASPTMAHHIEEVEEIAAQVDGVVLNMGATDDIPAMFLAGESAKKNNHIVVIDPVGVAASTFRRKKCLELIVKVKPDAIRGNLSEIKALIEDCNTALGVDDPDDKEANETFKDKVKKAAKNWNTIIIVSGKVDIVTDGEEYLENYHGDAMLKRITGSGCMTSSLLGAYLATDNTVQSAFYCMETMGLAGEEAAYNTKAKDGGTMTFRNELIDCVSKM